MADWIYNVNLLLEEQQRQLLASGYYDDHPNERPKVIKRKPDPDEEEAEQVPPAFRTRVHKIKLTE